MKRKLQSYKIKTYLNLKIDLHILYKAFKILSNAFYFLEPCFELLSVT